MIASVMMYGAAVAALIALAALAIERSCMVLNWPRRGVWALALLLSIVLPIMMLSIKHQQPLRHSFAENANYIEPTILHDDHATSIPLIPSAVRHPSWPALPNLDDFLKAVWVASSLGMLAFYALGWAMLRRAARNWPREHVDGLSIFVTDQLGPAVVGFLKPEIALPRWLLGASSSMRAMIMAHERAHIAARDPLLILGSLLLIALVPWNLPLLWQLHRLRFAIEVDCDSRVLRGGIAPSVYGEILLAVGLHNSKTPKMAIALTEPASQLERRIRAIVSGAYRHSKPIAVACTLLSVILVFACTQLNVPANASQVAGTQNPEMKRYKSDEWNFELDVPKSWNRFPPVSSNSPTEVTRLMSIENGRHVLIIFRSPHHPEEDLKSTVEETQQDLAKAGFSNFVESNTKIGAKFVMTLDFDKALDGKPWYCRHYFIADGPLMYVLGFGTTDRDVMFPLYDRMAKTFSTDD